MITGIVVALPEEAVTLTDKRIEKGRCLFVHDKILIACAGMGPANASTAAELLIAKGASQLISWGCAGALDHSLRPGDLLVANRLITAENEEIDLATDWFLHAQSLLTAAFAKQRKAKLFRTGLLTESEGLVDSVPAKKQLHAFTKALALDMESCAIARTAHRHGLPFLAIRAIADPACMRLPPVVVQATDADGNVSLGRLLTHLLLRPLQLPELIRLGLYFGKAKRTLKQAAGQLEAIAEFAYPNH